MAVEDGRCNCITEQGTHYDMDLKLCRAMVANGGSYNPTRRPVEHQEREQQDRQAQSTPDASDAPVAVVGAGASGLNHGAGVGSDYAGPEYQTWNAEYQASSGSSH